MHSRLGLISLVIVVMLAAAACDSHKPSRAASPASTQAGHPPRHTAATTVPANLSPGQARIVQRVLARALLAAHVGSFVQGVRSCGAEYWLVE